MDVYIALLHHPVVDRHNKIITSSVTNLDLHDIARSCCTFGVKKYFVVHPSEDEQALNRRIVHHWDSGYGKLAHPTRSPALDLLELVHEFSEVEARVKELSGKDPVKIATSARVTESTFQMTDLKEKLGDRPLLLLFGTAYGLAPSWNDHIDGYLGPINGPGEYNHLSVRSAVAIYLDRIAAI